MTETSNVRRQFIDTIRVNPLDEATRLVFADWLEEHGDVGHAEVFRSGLIPLTEIDTLAADRLSRCTFHPGTWVKRFARSIQSSISRKPVLTPKQYFYLWHAAYNFRAQIVTRVVVATAEDVKAKRDKAGVKASTTAIAEVSGTKSYG